MLGMQIDFNIPISGIAMRNQNAAPHQGTPTTTSIRTLLIAWLTALLPDFEIFDVLLMPL